MDVDCPSFTEHKKSRAHISIDSDEDGDVKPLMSHSSSMQKTQRLEPRIFVKTEHSYMLSEWHEEYGSKK